MDQANADRIALFDGVELVTDPISLPEAVARAIKYNLDKRVRMMDEAIALNQVDISRADFLPKLAYEAGYTGRSEYDATTSTDIDTHAESTSTPTYSTDRKLRTSNLTMSWNVLDFGVSYMAERQNQDRAHVAAERRRKVLHNLVQEIRFAYWRVAVAHALRDKVSNTVILAETALAEAKKVENESLKAPLESLQFQKTLLETIRQLEGINQELSTATVELAALINVPPGSDIQVNEDLTGDLDLPIWKMSLDDMEKLAFMNNPDLREHGYLARIAVAETKKAMLSMLPGITFGVDQEYTSNSFQNGSNWYGWSINLTWNIMDVITSQTRLKKPEYEKMLADTKRLSLRMAILAQVHVATKQFNNAHLQFKRADTLADIDQSISDLITLRQANETGSVHDKIAYETSAITSELRRYQAYIQLISAHGRLYSTLGIDYSSADPQEASLEDLTTSLEGPINGWREDGFDDALIGKLSKSVEPETITDIPVAVSENEKIEVSSVSITKKELPAEKIVPDTEIAGNSLEDSEETGSVVALLTGFFSWLD